MGSAAAECETLKILLLSFTSLLFLCLSHFAFATSNFSQGSRQNPEYRYPFIRRGSTFASSSSPSPSSSSRGGSLSKGGKSTYDYIIVGGGTAGCPLAPNSASQCFISTDGVFNSRARILGGGTCINAGFYTRASSSVRVKPDMHEDRARDEAWGRLSGKPEVSKAEKGKQIRVDRWRQRVQLPRAETTQRQASIGGHRRPLGSFQLGFVYPIF